MRPLLPLLCLLLIGIAGCATSTPIAVSTPTYHVPQADPLLRSKENAALKAAATSQAGWQQLVTTLPQAQAR